MNPHRIEDAIARNKQVMDQHDAAIAKLRRIIDAKPGTRPDLRLVQPSAAAQHHEPEREWPRWAERLLDWALAITMGMLMGIAAGAGF